MTKPVLPAAVSLVRHFEGLYLQAYLCPAGVPTIGFGHTKGVKMGQSTTPEQADAFLAADLAEAAEVVDFFVTVPLTDAQRGALASFVFNLGAGNLRSSTLLKLLNKGDYEGAAGQFGVWVKATVGGKKKTLAGLVARREAEEALFRGLDWTAPAADQRMPQAVQPEAPKPLTKSVTAQAAAGGLGIGGVVAAVGPLLAPAMETARQVQEVADQVQQAQQQVAGAVSTLQGIASTAPTVGALVMAAGLVIVLYRLWKDRRPS